MNQLHSERERRFLYRVWPRCLEAMVLVKPATVVG